MNDTLDAVEREILEGFMEDAKYKSLGDMYVEQLVRFDIPFQPKGTQDPEDLSRVFYRAERQMLIDTVMTNAREISHLLNAPTEAFFSKLEHCVSVVVIHAEGDHGPFDFVNWFSRVLRQVGVMKREDFHEMHRNDMTYFVAICMYAYMRSASFIYRRGDLREKVSDCIGDFLRAQDFVFRNFCKPDGTCYSAINAIAGIFLYLGGDFKGIVREHFFALSSALRIIGIPEERFPRITE